MISLFAKFDPFIFNKSGMDIQHDGMTWVKNVVNVETKKQKIATEDLPVTLHATASNIILF